MPHLFSTKHKYLFITLCFQLFVIQPIFSQNRTAGVQRKVEIHILDSLSMQAIPYLKLNIKEFNPLGDTLQRVGFTNEEGVCRITFMNPTTIHIDSKFYTKKIVEVKESKNATWQTIFLIPNKNELAEVVVNDRTHYQINKIEFRIKKLPKSQAPIAQNFLKTINGITLSAGDYKYLGKKILYYLDGVMVDSKLITESAIESFEKLEIISAPDGNYWMKSSEVVFNFVSKRTKNPTLGVPSNSEYALLFPYASQNLGIYYLGKKVSFRASSIYYSYKQNTQSETTQEINQIQSQASRQLQSTTTPNFNSFIFNYKLDSLTTISYHLSYQNIGHSQLNNFTFSPLTTEGLPVLESTSNRAYNKTGQGNLLLFQRQNHKLFIRYDYDHTNNEFQYFDTNTLTQSIIDKSKTTYINYANRFQLSKNTKLNTIISWENKNSKTTFESQHDLPTYTQFNSNFIGLKSIVATSYKKLSFLLGGRLDLINQYFESKATNYMRENQLRFLPTLSLQYESEKFGNFNFSLNSDYTLPDISQLATFSRRVDPYRNIIGNNVLSSENSLNLDFTHTTQVKKLDITTNIRCDETSDYLGYTPYKLEESQLTRSYTNLGKMKNLSFQLNTSFPLHKNLKNQVSLAQKYVHFELNKQLLYPNFNTQWLPIFSFSNSLQYQISTNFSASLNLYFNNYAYDFYETTSLFIPTNSLSINGTLGKSWYINVNWNTIFANANRSKIVTAQQHYTSITNETNNYRYVSISIQKSFGEKYNNVPASSTADEVKRKFKTI